MISYTPSCKVLCIARGIHTFQCNLTFVPRIGKTPYIFSISHALSKTTFQIMSLKFYIENSNKNDIKTITLTIIFILTRTNTLTVMFYLNIVYQNLTQLSSNIYNYVFTYNSMSVLEWFLHILIGLLRLRLLFG